MARRMPERSIRGGLRDTLSSAMFLKYRDAKKQSGGADIGRNALGLRTDANDVTGAGFFASVTHTGWGVRLEKREDLFFLNFDVVIC
jgi:hypothetical protein